MIIISWEGLEKV